MLELSNNWEKDLEGVLNRRVIHYLFKRFESRGIERPNLQDIKKITIEEVEASWLSVPSMYELMLFIQQIE